MTRGLSGLITVLGTAACLLAAAGAPAQTPTPKGSEFQVNTYTTNDQGNPHIAMGPEGDFIVVWHSTGSSGTDSSGDSVQGQRYASDGSALGDEFQVNTYTSFFQGAASVAIGPNGDFVVAWGSYGSSGSDTWSFSVHGQRFASHGSAVGVEFQVNTYTGYSQNGAVVAIDPEGDFIVLWDSDGSNGDDNWYSSIQGQRFSSDGARQGGDFQVNTYTTGDQSFASLGVDQDGDFVVVWASDGSSFSDSSDSSVQGQRYASNGSTVDVEFQVNAYTTGYQRSPAVAVDPDGDFIVVWQSSDSSFSDTSNFSIQGLRFSSNGSELGSQFQVNSYTTNYQGHPTLALDPDGGFVVTWFSYGSGDSDVSLLSIHGQRFASSGTTIGNQFQVNSYTTSFQIGPEVVADAAGDFVIIWQSTGSANGDTSGKSVQGQRYSDRFFADGFETGDTTAWSATVGGP